MAAKDQDRVDEILLKISTEIEQLKSDIDKMEAQISKWSYCTGTKENPHNHNADISDLRVKISSCEDAIDSLEELKLAVLDTSRSLDEIDAELTKMLEELADRREDGELSVPQRTSAMIKHEIDYLESEIKGYENLGQYQKANSISSTSLNNLKNEYITTFQSEIDELCDRVVRGGQDYRSNDDIINKTKELIEYVNLNNLAYPSSSERKKLTSLKSSYPDIQARINRATSYEERKALQSKLDEMEQLGQAAIDKMLMVRDLSVEQNAHTVLAKVEQSIDIIAVEHGSQDQLNKILCYKLDLAEGECYYDIISTHDLPNDEKHNTLIGLSSAYSLLNNQGKNTLLADKALLHWITVLEKGNDVKENPLPEWWLKNVPKIPSNIVNENNYNSQETYKNMRDNYYANYYGILEEIANPTSGDNGVKWYGEMFGHLDPESDSVQRRKYLLEEMGLGTYKNQKHGLTVYTNEELPEFKNAQMLYLNLYGHYDTYYNDFKIKQINGDKTVARWMNEDRNNKITLSAEDQAFADDIINGIYVQANESVEVLSSENVWVYEDEFGFVIDTVVNENDRLNHYNYIMAIDKHLFANQTYLKTEDFFDKANQYYDFKINSNLYVRQCTPGDYNVLIKRTNELIESNPAMTEYYNSLSDDARLTADEYMMNYVASLRDRDEIQNFSLSRFSDKMVGVVKGAIDFASIAAGILLSAVGAPLVAVVVAPLLLEAINVKICLEQGNNAEAVLRIIGTAVGAGIGIKSIVKAGTSAFKAVAATYGDDVARAIAEYGDDLFKIESKFGKVTADKVDDILKRSLDDVVGGAGKKYSPLEPHPTLPKGVQDSFNGGIFTQKVLKEDTIFYRVYGGDSGKVGSYLTRIPQNGAMQSQLDLALNPAWGNTAEYVTKVVVPKGTVIYEGITAPQGILLGGGNQVYIPREGLNPLWFGN